MLGAHWLNLEQDVVRNQAEEEQTESLAMLLACRHNCDGHGSVSDKCFFVLLAVFSSGSSEKRQNSSF